MEPMAALRDSWTNLHHWATNSAIQTRTHHPKVASSSAITEGFEEKKKEWRFEDSEPFKKKKEKVPVYFRISKRINTKQNQFKNFRRFTSNLRIKPGKIINLPLHFVQEQQRVSKRCRTVRIHVVLVQNHKTLTFFPKNFKIPRFTTLIHRRKPTNQQIKTYRKRFEPEFEPKLSKIHERKFTIYIVSTVIFEFQW